MVTKGQAMQVFSLHRQPCRHTLHIKCMHIKTKEDVGMPKKICKTRVTLLQQLLYKNANYSVKTISLLMERFLHTIPKSPCSVPFISSSISMLWWLLQISSCSMLGICNCYSDNVSVAKNPSDWSQHPIAVYYSYKFLCVLETLNIELSWQ